MVSPFEFTSKSPICWVPTGSDVLRPACSMLRKVLLIVPVLVLSCMIPADTVVSVYALGLKATDVKSAPVITVYTATGDWDAG